MADALWQDLRLAWRAVRRAPAFSLAVVLTFSVGMAGATSMFALIEGVLLRPLAVPDEDQLVVGWRQLPNLGNRRWSFTAAQIEALQANSRRLGSVAAVGYNDPLPWAIAERGSVAFAQGARGAGLLAAVSAVACAIPAVRAARIDPVLVLREQ